MAPSMLAARRPDLHSGNEGSSPSGVTATDHAIVMKQADLPDRESGARKGVWVRLPPMARPQRQRGGTADSLGSEPGARKGVRVQIPPLARGVEKDGRWVKPEESRSSTGQDAG